MLDEAKKTEEDFRHRLAGQIEKETGYSEEQRNKIIPFLSPYLGVYNECFQRFQNKKYEHGAPEYVLLLCGLIINDKMNLTHHMTMMVNYRL